MLGLALMLASASAIVVLGVRKFCLITIFALLVQGAVTVGSVGGFNPVFIGVALALCAVGLGERHLWASKPVRISTLFVGCSLLALSVGSLASSQPAVTASERSFIAYLLVFEFFVLAGAAYGISVCKPVFASALVHVVLAIYEVLSGNSLFYADWKPIEATKFHGITRAASTVADPNYLSLTLLVIGVILIDGARDGRTNRRYFWIGIAALATIALTFSRAGLVALGVSVVTWLLFSRRFSVSMKLATLVSVSCATVVGAMLAPNNLMGALSARYLTFSLNDASIAQRSVLQEYGYHLFTQHLAFGLGPGVFGDMAAVLRDPTKPYNVQTDVLNTYLEVGLAGGAILLIPFLGLVVYACLRAVKCDWFLGYGLCGLVVAIATLNTWELVPLWLALAVAVTRGRSVGSKPGTFRYGSCEAAYESDRTNAREKREFDYKGFDHSDASNL